MQMSERGKDLLAQWEGVREKLYLDPVGLATIGIGHLLTRDEISSGKLWIKGAKVKYYQGLTRSQVMDLLDQDLEIFEKAINDSVKVELTQDQFDALASFSFNVGAHAFVKSTLLKVLNQGQYEEVPRQLRRWVYAGGKKLKGMINRREHEVALWEGRISD